MPPISFSGLASGIDGDAIIKAMLDAKRAPLEQFKNNMQSNKDESQAIAEFNTKLLALRSKLQDFATVNGSAVSKSAASSDPEAVAAHATNNALVSTSTVHVESLARAATISFQQRFPSLDSPLAPNLLSPEPLQITLGSGDEAETFSIEISAGTTLRSLVEQINNTLPGVRATAVNGGSSANPEYVLTLSGSVPGADEGRMVITVPQELAQNGILSAQTVQQAQDAVVTMSGIGEIRRPTNTLSDVIPGVTLELKRAGSSSVVTVRDDTGKTATRFREIVDSFNDLNAFIKDRNFIRSNEEDGEFQIRYGVLAKTRIDDELLHDLRSALLASAASTEGAVQSFADAGLITERNGSLRLDDKVFADVAAKDPKGLDSLLRSFADKVSATDGVIDRFTRFRGRVEIALTSNDTENNSINDRLARAEALIQRQAEILKRSFVNLETTIGKLNASGDSLLSLLGTLPQKK